MKIPNFIARRVLENVSINVDCSEVKNGGSVRVYTYVNNRLVGEHEASTLKPYTRIPDPFTPAPKARNTQMRGGKVWKR